MLNASDPQQTSAASSEEPALRLTRPTVKKTRFRKRHLILLISFLGMVLAPIIAVFWYLETRAADQYASKLGFTVQQAENTTAAVDLIGGISSLGGGGSKNTDILFEYIQSQQLISEVDQALDLGMLYSKPENDPFFAFDPDGTIEDLVAYWDRMVKIYYDNKTGLIELRVLAFDPDDAHAIAQEIVRKSSAMINALNNVAQEDATIYANEELDQAIERLKTARQALTTFRVVNQIVDPNADLQGQMGLLNSLQQQMADALIEMDLLSDVTGQNDPRIGLALRKIEVIRARIGEERQKLVSSEGTGGDFSSLIGTFEALRVDLEFAEQSYVSALSAYDGSVADARRKSTYLAAYVEPTRAQRSEYPNRIIILALTGLFLFLIWSVLALVAYSIRDRQ